MMDLILYKPHMDPAVVALIERMHPPRVIVDNDSCSDCTLVKVDGANRHGILLEMVQFLTDLDLIILKSYITSDGGWLMDVFHVTDQKGKKISDENLIRYIQHAFGTGREIPKDIQLCLSSNIRPTYVSSEQTALEITVIDKPGLMSEISAVLADSGCHVSSAVVWTHKSRAAIIVYLADDDNEGGNILDPLRVAYIRDQLEKVINAHHSSGERRSVRLAWPSARKTHIERRLHQLLAADGDYESCSCSCCQDISSKDEDIKVFGKVYEERMKHCDAPHVKVEDCAELGYSIVTVRCRDRPRLLFDTVCTLTDMQYSVYHAFINSEESKAFQEYYIRHKSGLTLVEEVEKWRLAQCLSAATERRVSHGVRLDVSTKNRLGLLSDVTRVIRENGLSIATAEIGSDGDRAVGTFYVKDASGQDINRKALETVKKEIGVTVEIVDESSQSTGSCPDGDRRDDGLVDRTKFSLVSLLWSHLKRLSCHFKAIIS